MLNRHASMSIEERIQWILDLNRQHSDVYCSPEAQLARKQYLAKHNTLIIVLKCMDGRIHIPCATQTPLGIILPIRNLGGIFDLGWPHLGEVVFNAVNEAVSAGDKVLFLITYHFSKGSRERGCAGFHYDQDAAFRHTFEIRKQLEQIFGDGHQTVYPMVCGFETDEEALIFHGEGDRALSMATLQETPQDELHQALRTLCPDMPGRIASDLLPLMEGNIRHIAETRQQQRDLNIDHQEWMLCIGRGFDFLHVPNVALIVGPYSPDLSTPIARAAGIIKANMEAGRIRDDGFFLLASSPYREVGVDRARAVLKARFLADFACKVIEEAHPDIHCRMIRKTAVLNWHTRALEIMDHRQQPELCTATVAI
jgi:hypothetical protein